jgi:polyhydroxybutyrate depolymerase
MQMHRRMIDGRRRTLGLAAAAAALVAGCGTAVAVSTTTRTAAGTPGSSLPTFPRANQEPPRQCTPQQVASRMAPIIHRPSWLPPSRPAPLLIALHGAFGNPQTMEGISHFKGLADQKGFVVVYLAACDLNHPWGEPQDVSYVSSMITQLTSSPSLAGAIDPARVYVTGFSAGGAQTWEDACQLSRQIAAIAVVSDAMNGRLYSTCKLSHPIPELLMVGTADGTRWTGIPGRLPDPYQTTALWRSLDGCGSGTPQVQQVSTVQQETWTGCTDGSAVALYIIQGAHHVWPPYGEGAPQDYSASAAVWSFLSQFRSTPTGLTGADARLGGVRTKTQGGNRLVLVSLALSEPLTATLVLLRPRGFRPRQRTVLSQVGASRPTVQLKIPGWVRAGKYRLSVTLTDTYGRSFTLQRAVKLPKPPPKKH